jgi:hypothetical protein
MRDIGLSLFANCEYDFPMILKPQDVVILLKIVALDEKEWSYPTLAGELFMSVSETHGGIKRAVAARLAEPGAGKRKTGAIAIRKTALEEFLIHGVKYAFPPDRGEITRGMPTGYAAPFFVKRIASSNDPSPVWPTPEGAFKGYAFSPLYKSVPKSAGADIRLYELLALLDAIRDGRARERDIAAKDIRSRLSKGW